MEGGVVCRRQMPPPTVALETPYITRTSVQQRASMEVLYFFVLILTVLVLAYNRVPLLMAMNRTPISISRLPSMVKTKSLIAA